MFGTLLTNEKEPKNEGKTKVHEQIELAQHLTFFLPPPSSLQCGRLHHTNKTKFKVKIEHGACMVGKESHTSFRIARIAKVPTGKVNS